MAAPGAHSAGEGVLGTRGGGAFADARQHVAHGLTRMQEALHQQCQVTQRQLEQRTQEALQRQEQRLQSEFRQQLQESQHQHDLRTQEALQTQERRLQGDFRQLLRDAQQLYEQKNQEALRAQEQRLQEEFRQQLQAAMRQQEQTTQLKLLGIESKLGSVEDPRSTSRDAEGEEKKHLEARMQKLEAYVEKALENVFPRVDAMLSRLEKSSSQTLSSSASVLAPSVISSVEIPDPRPPSPVVTPSRPTSTQSPPPLNATADRPQALVDLEEAVAKGKLDVVRWLLDAGLDVDVRVQQGLTPLMLAAKEAHPTVVALLLERDADVHATTASGNTALQFAAFNDRSGRCVALLVAAGANVNSRDVKGFMPLHRAVSIGNEAAARALLRAGASRTAKDHTNLAPIDYARSSSMRQLLEF